jgi:hypothetical protein
MPAGPAHALVRAAAVLAAQPDAGVAEIGQGLREWLEGGGTSDLAEALGARRDVSRLDGADLETRDALLRAVAAKHFSGWTSLSSRAGRLHDALERYAASSWRRDQWAETCPYEPGTRADDFWNVLRVSSHVPSPRTLRRLLAIAPTDGQLGE